jgi:hypothetical protein
LVCKAEVVALRIGEIVGLEVETVVTVEWIQILSPVIFYERAVIHSKGIVTNNWFLMEIAAVTNVWEISCRREQSPK